MMHCLTNQRHYNDEDDDVSSDREMQLHMDLHCDGEEKSEIVEPKCDRSRESFKEISIGPGTIFTVDSSPVQRETSHISIEKDSGIESFDEWRKEDSSVDLYMNLTPEKPKSFRVKRKIDVKESCDVETNETNPTFGDLDLYSNFLSPVKNQNQPEEKYEQQKQLCAELELSKRELEKQNEILLINISRLYKTARKEIMLKNKEILKLKERLDNMIFRRQGYQPENNSPVFNNEWNGAKHPRDRHYDSPIIKFSGNEIDNRSPAICLRNSESCNVQVKKVENIDKIIKPRCLNLSGNSKHVDHRFIDQKKTKDTSAETVHLLKYYAKEKAKFEDKTGRSGLAKDEVLTAKVNEVTPIARKESIGRRSKDNSMKDKTISSIKRKYSSKSLSKRRTISPIKHRRCSNSPFKHRHGSLRHKSGIDHTPRRLAKSSERVRRCILITETESERTWRSDPDEENGLADNSSRKPDKSSETCGEILTFKSLTSTDHCKNEDPTKQLPLPNNSEKGNGKAVLESRKCIQNRTENNLNSGEKSQLQTLQNSVEVEKMNLANETVEMPQSLNENSRKSKANDTEMKSEAKEVQKTSDIHLKEADANQVSWKLLKIDPDSISPANLRCKKQNGGLNFEKIPNLPRETESQSLHSGKENHHTPKKPHLSPRKCRSHESDRRFGHKRKSNELTSPKKILKAALITQRKMKWEKEMAESVRREKEEEEEIQTAKDVEDGEIVSDSEISPTLSDFSDSRQKTRRSNVNDCSRKLMKVRSEHRRRERSTSPLYQRDPRISPLDGDKRLSQHRRSNHLQRMDCNLRSGRKFDGDGSVKNRGSGDGRFEKRSRRLDDGREACQVNRLKMKVRKEKVLLMKAKEMATMRNRSVVDG